MQNIIKNWDGGELSTQQYGELENAVVLIHGWACNQTFWNDITSSLNNKNIITIDLAGHGESTAGGRNWSIAEFAKDVAVVTEYYGLKNHSLVGHSMGGMVALQAAANDVSNINSLIQLDTFVFDYGFLPKDLQQDILDGFNNDFNGAVTKLVTDTSGSLAVDTQQWVIEQMMKTNAQQASAMFADYMKCDPRPAMEKVQGKHSWLSSGLINTESRARYAAHLNQELILPQTGHFLGQQVPGQVAAGLNYLLAT